MAFNSMTKNLPAGVNVSKAKVKRSKNKDWSWEDEMLLYDVSQRDATKKKRIAEREEIKEMTQDQKDELKKLQKDSEMTSLYQREERKLFLGGLSPEMVEKDLRKHFVQFGQLVDCQVMRDKQTGTSRGFGFVTFACSFMAEAAMEAEEHVVNGQTIIPKLATPDTARLNKTIPELEAQVNEDCKHKRSIYVGALKETIQEHDLINYFTGFGTVIRASIMLDRESGEKKKYGFVDFQEFGVVGRVMNYSKHYIQGKRIRVELSRPRIEFSHQTKTVFVGGLEDGIDDPELLKYFSEFGFVTRALRIPNKDQPKRKYGFVDFDDYDAVDIVVGQREHYIHGHRVQVELALPMLNDTLYETEIIVPGETWIEKVQRKLQYAIPDQGTWGETMNTYDVFVLGGKSVTTQKFKIPRAMLEYVVGMAGKIVEEIANDSNTRITLDKPVKGAKHCVFSITGKVADVKAAQYIFQKIVKANLNKQNVVRPITNS